MMIERSGLVREVERRFATHPVVLLSGPKYCGKTVLARRLAESASEAAFFDLFVPEDERLLENPARAPLPRAGLVVLDEAQKLPDFDEGLRLLTERRDPETRTLLLGRGATALARRASEVLGARLGVVDLAGFDLGEISGRSGGWRRLWERGGYPTSYLASSPEISHAWRDDYLRGIADSSIQSLGDYLPSRTIREYLRVLGLRHGDLWRPTHFARAMGRSSREARRYLDYLAGECLVRILPAYAATVKRRQVRSPIVYVRDSGLLHALIGGTSSPRQIQDPPGVERSFAGFVVEQVARRMGRREYRHWRAEGGVGLTLLFRHRGRGFGVETRFAAPPKSTWKLRAAVRDLDLERLFVVHPGTERTELDARIEALPVTDLPTAFPPEHDSVH